MVPTHTSMQVIVHSWLPGPTRVYTHGGEVVTLVQFLNTPSSCVHTHSHTRKDKHTQLFMLLTRTFTQQKGSGVFSFDPTHTILDFCTVSQTSSTKHKHRWAQIFTRKSVFWHPRPQFFFCTLRGGDLHVNVHRTLLREFNDQCVYML